jgi:hypothetical protein
MTLKQAIKATLLQQPGLSSTEIARRLGKERNNVRKAAFELETAGELRSQNDGGTFRFYLVETAQSSALPAVAKSATSVIDATYRDVTEPSSGRALVVSQPADSRTEAALRQHAVARARHQRQGGGRLPANFAMSLNAVFEADPDGVETWSALQQAQFDRLKAATAHEQWLREEHARQVAEAERRKEAETKKKRDEEIAGAIRHLLHMGEEEPPPRQRGNVRPLAYEEEEEPEPPPSIDRFQQKQRELRELSERAESASIWEAERLAKQGPDSAKAREPARRPDTVRQFLARAKSAPPEPPAKSWWQWPVAIAALGVFAAIVFVIPLQQ